MQVVEETAPVEPVEPEVVQVATDIGELEVEVPGTDGALALEGEPVEAEPLVENATIEEVPAQAEADAPQAELTEEVAPAEEAGAASQPDTAPAEEVGGDIAAPDAVATDTVPTDAAAADAEPAVPDAISAPEEV